MAFDILPSVTVIINMYFSNSKSKWIWASNPWNDSWKGRKCLSHLLGVLSEQTKNFNIPRCPSVKPVILSETVLSNSVNLRSHQHGQNRKYWKPILSVYITFIVFLIWSAVGCIFIGNWTELSPIRTLFIPVINKVGRPQRGSQFVNQDLYYRQN